MGEYERAETDARFGMIMAENLLRDSMFMWLYGRIEAHAPDDEDPRPAGG